MEAKIRRVTPIKKDKREKDFISIQLEDGTWFSSWSEHLFGTLEVDKEYDFTIEEQGNFKMITEAVPTVQTDADMKDAKTVQTEKPEVHQVHQENITRAYKADSKDAQIRSAVALKGAIEYLSARSAFKDNEDSKAKMTEIELYMRFFNQLLQDVEGS